MPSNSGRIAARSVTSVLTSLRRGDCECDDRFSGRPIAKLSITTTSWPSPSRRSTRWLPMKPAPPVTTHFITGYIHREAAAEQASPNQYLVGADYQPPEDSASVTKLFG